MRKKQLPFILSAAICLTSGMTVIGSESSDDTVALALEAEPSFAEESAEAYDPAPEEAIPEEEPLDEESAEEDPEEEGSSDEKDIDPDAIDDEIEIITESEEETSDGGSEIDIETEAETSYEREEETPGDEEEGPEFIQEEELDIAIADEIIEFSGEELEVEVQDFEEEETEIMTEEAEETTYVSGSGEVVSDGGLGELYVAVNGYPVGDLTENEKDVYLYLRQELGLNKAAASGVLSNVYFESNFSSVAVGDGGTSLGLCQWHLGRCKSLMSWCDAHDLDYRSVEGQLGYLDYELNNIYKDVYGYLQDVPDTAEGAYSAGYYFCMYFESPTDTKTRSEARGTMAQNSYYPSDLDKFLTEEREVRTHKGVKLSDRARLVVMIDNDEE